jgi:chaperonin GroEL
MEKVGKEGVITVEEGSGLENELDVVEGMQFDRGYLSPYFITNQAAMQVELETPTSCCTTRRSPTSVNCCRCSKVRRQGRPPLLIIAEDIEGEALATLVVNNMRGIVKVAAVKAPGFGDRRKAMLQDIAILTGGQVISEEVGLSPGEGHLDDLGRPRRSRSPRKTPPSSTVPASASDIEGRVDQIRARSKTPAPTTTARSCRSAWPSWPAVWP